IKAGSGPMAAKWRRGSGVRALHSAIAALAVLAWALSALARDGAGFSLGRAINPSAANPMDGLQQGPRPPWSRPGHPGRPAVGAATVYVVSVPWARIRHTPRNPG